MRARFERFAAYTLPFADVSHLKLHALWLCWTHLFDDPFDEGQL
ncbi:hypothetical protein ACPOL_5536 [Acidisarcina polymorpha]|uniref:Uncharacterized protein n=1 Tax=Acidisarcina polymorpha TaxID=2211140 RepID=A0A2Z5G7W5_9BACT|nr:hypothetical protein ACPOL_5536 [Acidisarcina polymorpha]